nr:ABC transporter substrate binding protein [uncultured Carboxylicivirga sp.]
MQVVNGLHSVFDSCGVHLDVEFMDSKRHPDSINISTFYNLMSYKINSSSKYDAIIASDDNALEFVLKYQNELFYHIPIIFTGINNSTLASAQNKNNWVTGIAESVSMKENIDLIIKLFPKSDKIYYIVDNKKTSLKDLDLLNSFKHEYNNISFEELNLSQSTFNEFGRKLNKIPNNKPVLLISAYTDSSNENFDFDQSLAFIKANLTAPIIHLYEHGLGDGILGGKLVSHEIMGKQAALMTYQILNGKNIKDIPVILDNKNSYLFDNIELHKYGINRSLLPEGSIIINRPGIFYKISITSSILIILFIIIQSFIIAYLIRSNRLKRKIKQSLRQKIDDYVLINERYYSLNEELNTKVNELNEINRKLEINEERYRLTALASNDGIWDWDLETNNVYFSERWKTMLGYSKDELDNQLKTWSSLVHKDDIDNTWELVQKYINGDVSRYEVEFRMLHKNGSYINMLSRGLLMRNSNGIAYRIIGTHQDLTERYKFENNLKNQIKENESLSNLYKSIGKELAEKNKELTEISDTLDRNYQELKLKNDQIAISEKKYKMLFNNLSEGFVLHKIILNNNNEPIDYIFIDVNPTFLMRAGIKYEDIINKKASTLYPNTELKWLKTFGKVAITGQPEHITEYSVEFDKYYDTTVFCPEPGYFAAIFKDITSEINSKIELEDSFKEMQIKEHLLQQTFNSVPVTLMILNEHGEITKINNTGLNYTNKTLQDIIGKRGGDYLSCINVSEHKKGCGHSKLCQKCLINNSINHVIFSKESLNKIPVDITILDQNKPKVLNLLLTSTIISNSNEVLVCLEDITSLKQNEIKLKKFNFEIKQLLRGAKEVLSINDFSKTITNLFNYSFNITEATSGFVGLIDKSNTQILHLVRENISISIEDQFKISNTDYITECYETLKAIKLNKSKIQQLQVLSIEINNAIYVPIQIDNVPIGIIVLLNKKQNFTQDDINIVSAFSELAALSFNNTKVNKLIEESEEKFRTAFNIGPDSINISTFDGILTYVNQRFKEIFEYSTKEVIGKNVTELQIWANPNDRIKYIEELQSKGHIENFEAVFRTKHGKLKTILISAVTIHIDHQTLILSIVRDITSLKLERYYLEKAQEIGNIGSWKFDINRNEFTWSQECYKLFNFEKDTEVSFDLFFSHIHPDDLDMVKDAWKMYLSGKKKSIEFRAIIDGKTKWFYEKTDIEFDANNRPSRVMGIKMDITERKNAEKQLNQINKRFEGLENIINYKAKSIHDLIGYTLKNVINYTYSSFGAVYHYDENKQLFFLNNWSEEVALSVDISKEEHKLNCLSKAVITKQPVITNGSEENYSFLNSNLNKDNSLKSLTVPVIVDNKVVAIFWVANYKNNYQDFHAKQIMLLLETTWIIVEKQRLQQNNIN